MNSRIIRFFLHSAAVVLLLAAAAKIYSATGNAKILSAADPLIYINNRALMWVLGSLEVAVAAYLILSRNYVMRALTLFWLSSNFILYRFGIYLLGVKMCPCLGTLSSKIPLTKAQTEHLLAAFVLYWFLGSACILSSAWNDEDESPVATDDAPAKTPIIAGN